MLNEIAAAASCLLHRETRATYNVQLRKGSDEQSIAPPPSAPGPLAAPKPAELELREPAPPPLPRAEPTAPPIAQDEPLVDATAANDRPPLATAAPAEPPVDSWHVQTPDGAYWGPVSLGEVEGWAADGRISAGSYLLPAGSDQWIAATRVIVFPAAPGRYASSAGAPPLYGAPAADQARCPNCQSADSPLASSSISAVGWVVFVLLIFLFCPLCFLGLLITEPRRVCRRCGHRFHS
jgi:hypothetical protein